VLTELRRRMDDDMLVRGFADRTRESYLWAVTGLARFYHRSPDQISDAEIQAYLVHLLRDRHRSWSTCNIVVNGLRFFCHTTLKRDRTTFTIPSPRQSGKLPVVLSCEEVQRLISHATNPRHRTMLMTTYAAGLRLNEVLHLRVHDIDSARMMIRSSKARAEKIGSRSCRPASSRSCARTGKSSGPRSGCFRRGAAGQPAPWIRRVCKRPIRPPSVERGGTKPGGIHTLRSVSA